MKTITIEDPADVLEAMQAEYPTIKPSDITATFGRDGWTLCLWHESETIRGSGASAQYALAQLRSKYEENSPEEKLRAEAAKLGMKLVPADQ